MREISTLLTESRNSMRISEPPPIEPTVSSVQPDHSTLSPGVRFGLSWKAPAKRFAAPAI
ncbi:MAG: hypothetical protein R3C45_05295 [Phycisphaerales bacterium]